MFLVVHLKYVSVMILVNQTKTRKLWEIVHENGPKMQNYEIWSCHSKLVLSVMKTAKTKSHSPCKLSRNPKTMGNSS
jgi:hypothetical protein